MRATYCGGVVRVQSICNKIPPEVTRKVTCGIRRLGPEQGLAKERVRVSSYMNNARRAIGESTQMVSRDEGTSPSHD